MNELALFAGAGGGLLASKHLLGHRIVGYVEHDPYCARVLQARIADGLLDDAPIWDDARTFDGRPWRGRVDLISAGFPCQPFSSAARGRNNATDLWPDTERIISEVRPRLVFLENVSRRPILRAAARLAGGGYRCAVTRLSAAAVGAPHLRRRWWLLGDADGDGKSGLPVDAEVAGLPEAGENLWGDHPGSVGVAHGVASRVDRLRALGNGQVSIVAATAFRILMQRVMG